MTPPFPSIEALTRAQRSGFLLAVRRLGGVFAAYRRATGDEPVIVGGGAVILHTAGRFFSGDIDFIAGHFDVMDGLLLAAGYHHEDRPGFLRVGWYHPAEPLFGFQQVSGRLFDGRAAIQRCRRLVGTEVRWVATPSVEDLIADRLGQHAVASPTDRSMLLQARALAVLHPESDAAYLRRRVSEEGGSLALLGAMPLMIGDADPGSRPEGLVSYWKGIERRAAAAGLLSPEASEAMRNPGDRRTAEKRELLSGIAARLSRFGR